MFMPCDLNHCCISAYQQWMSPCLASCLDDVRANLEYLPLGSSQSRWIHVTDQKYASVITGADLKSVHIIPWGTNAYCSDIPSHECIFMYLCMYLYMCVLLLSLLGSSFYLLSRILVQCWHDKKYCGCLNFLISLHMNLAWCTYIASKSCIAPNSSRWKR